MAVLVLIRHAHTATAGKRLTGTAPGIHLSDDGRSQAAALAERLAAVPFAALYSSPLERCMETAEPVASRRGILVQSLPAIREVEYGRWTGRTIAQLSRSTLWKVVQRSPSRVRFPDGETLREVQARAVGAMEDLADAHPAKVIGVVTHADVIRLVLAHYAGIHLDLYQRLSVSPASITVISVGDHGPRVFRVNDVGSTSDLIPPAPRSSGRPRAERPDRPPTPRRSPRRMERR